MHNFTLLGRKFNIWTSWYEKNHCLWENWNCIMEQADIWKKKAAQIALETANRVRWLCKDCMNELQTNLSFYRQLWSKF